MKIILMLALLAGCLEIGGTNSLAPTPAPTCKQLWGYGSGVLLFGDHISNQNDFTVTVRMVWQARGETTKRIDILKPGESEYLEFVYWQHAWYISRDGQEIGFFSPGNDCRWKSSEAVKLRRSGNERKRKPNTKD